MQHFDNNRNNVRKYLLKYAVLLLIFVALVPYGWVTQYSSGAAFVVNIIFAGEGMHIVGHFLLFALMGTAVLAMLPRLKNHPKLYFSLMLLIGFAQEVLQLVTFKLHPFSSAEAFDLIIDLLGAALAFVAMRRLSKKVTVQN